MTITRLADIGVNNYGDALGEARLCRDDSALFDFSFMFRARITGSDALQKLNSLQSRDLSTMKSGEIRYCLCSYDGHVGADITVWKFSDECYEIFSGRHQEIKQISTLVNDRNKFQDLSGSTSIFSIQGPGSPGLLSRLSEGDTLAALSYFHHEKFIIGGIQCQVGRLGYTGEKGFEIVVDDRANADILWSILAELSLPAGVAAIDILRIEAGFILFLNECRMPCNALELGLDKFSESGQSRCRFELVCFQADEQAIEMPWSPSQALLPPKAGEIVVSSASLSTLSEGIIGLGFARLPYYRGDAIKDPAGLFHNIKIVNRPLYDPQKIIPRSN